MCGDNFKKITKQYRMTLKSFSMNFYFCWGIKWFLRLLVLLGVLMYASLFVGYYTIMLPFFILAFPFKFFISGFNFSSYFIVDKALALLYVCFFPQIKELMFNTFEDTSVNILNSFEIKPKKIMSAVPFLVQKKIHSGKAILSTFWCAFLLLLSGSQPPYLF